MLVGLAVVMLHLFSFLWFSSPPLILQGQQAHEEDAGRGAASKERVGAHHQESFEEHERPQLG